MSREALVRKGLDDGEQVIAAVIQLTNQGHLDVFGALALQIVCGLSCQHLDEMDLTIGRSMRIRIVGGNHPHKSSVTAQQRRRNDSAYSRVS